MRDLDLIRLHWPAELRPAFDALMALDDTLADIVATSTQPALGAIRLAWWREALERLDAAPPPAEPRLQAVAAELLPLGLIGADLANLEAGWATVLDDTPDGDALLARGRVLAAFQAHLLGATADWVGEAGAVIAAADLARRGMADLRGSVTPLKVRVAKPLRPLGAMLALANRDLKPGPMEAEAGPARAVTLLRMRMTGRS